MRIGRKRSSFLCAILMVAFVVSPAAARGMPGPCSYSILRIATLEGQDSGACWLVGEVIPPSELEDRIREMLVRMPGTWSVYAKDLETGREIALDADQELHPASTIKFAIAMEVMAWMDRHPEVTLAQGPMKGPGRTFEQLLMAMLIQSEEWATEHLENFVDGQEDAELGGMLRLWGAEHTRLDPRRSTARELGLLMEQLALGEVLSPDSNERVLEILRTPSYDDEVRIGGGLPDCLRAGMAHKRGTSYEGGIDVVGDVALVDVNGRQYVLAVIGNGVPWAQEANAETLISEVSSMVLMDFMRPKVAQDPQLGHLRCLPFEP